MITDILALFSVSAFAAPLPPEICRLAGTHTVKVDHRDDGKFEYEAELSARHTFVPTLVRKVIAHTHSKGFRMMESEIRHNDADLRFRRGR